ncbi:MULTISPECIES: phosphopyruvate hydratase [unclassified Beijerinckia]|uniref:phosphopyruvate hydratase n=1 Tax=unclassified Beijerinckia TaxID=2638183 RepID=UPI00089ABD21|nr:MULTISPECIES: phosphopyruvate hydratase [unclassified Beijerinckia]MDH7795409.1 enolase [Beijerinckia sp. GAS462]SEC00353.1 enolase [Beijerinckia sp. 28-YEA-48]
MTTAITAVHPRRVWDSRGRPTVEVEVHLDGGAIGRAIAPAGASVGSGEAVDLRDGGKAFGGYDVTKAIAAVRDEIAPALIGQDATQQAAIDTLMTRLDGTPQRSRLGGNALVATSMAVLLASANAAALPLWRYLAKDKPIRMPLPEIQIFGGGAHADGRVDIQDFMIMCPAARSFADALDWTAEVYRAAGAILKSSGRLRGVADEGGFWPEFRTNEETIETLIQAIEQAGFKPGKQIVLSLDIAASNFRRDGAYHLGLEGRKLDIDGMIRLVGGWIEAYPIASVEDPVAEDDRDGFVAFAQKYATRCQIVGDDYLVTNAARVTHAIADKTVNAVLIKPNQAGTITEALAALTTARAAGLATLVSARSGETEDVTISHLSAGWDAGQLKVGSFTRSERMAKWNESLRIEEASGAPFAGWAALPKMVNWSA